MGPMMVPQPSSANQIMPYPMSSTLIYDDRTLDSMIERPITDIKFDKTNFSDRIKEYEEGYEKEETEFRKQEESRRSKFNRYIDRKKEKLRDEIKRFEENYNPFEILGLEDGDLEMGNIRKAYKKMALKYHPDKVGDKYGDHFQIITQSYIYLLNKAEKMEKSRDRELEREEREGPILHDRLPLSEPSRDANPQYSLSNMIAEREREMMAIRGPSNIDRKESLTTVDPVASAVKRPRGRPRKIQEEPKKVVDLGGKAGVPRDTPLNRFMDLKKSREMPERSMDDGPGDIMDVNQKNFDINKFNTLFEKYKFDDDETTRGYGDLLKNGMEENDGDGRDQGQIFSKSMSKEIFNAHFDEMKKGKSSSSRRDNPVLPDAIDSSSRTNCAQIGGAGNFSGSNYTDIKQAFYEDNMLIDPSTVKIKQYKNLQELENERSRVSHEPDRESSRRYQQYEEQQKAMEEDRLRAVRHRDDALKSHNHHVSKKFMVNGKKVE
jgi:curved DNA-binding protein CbpA